MNLTGKRDKPQGFAPPGTALVETNTVMPRVQAPLRTLVLALTVMCYLAAIAIGAMLLINRAVEGWTSDIAGEITVQVREIEGADIEQELAKAATIINETSGILAIRVLSRGEGLGLLEPWLGKTAILDELPVPRLIAITVDRAAPPDLQTLRVKLAQSVKGAVLDTHRRWQGELTAMASTMRWLAGAVLLLISGCAVALVVFATRTALDANRDVLEVLYLVGARDRFIASQVERRFLTAGLRGGMAGTLAGLLTFALMSATGRFGAPSGLAEASSRLLFGPPETTYAAYLVFAIIPLVATVIALMTARWAVFRILRSIF